MEVSIKKTCTVQPQEICFCSYKTFCTAHSSYFRKCSTSSEPATCSMLRRLNQGHAPHSHSISSTELIFVYYTKYTTTFLLDFCTLLPQT